MNTNIIIWFIKVLKDTVWYSTQYSLQEILRNWDGLTLNKITRCFFSLLKFVDHGYVVHVTYCTWHIAFTPLRAKTNRFQKFLSRSDSTNEPEGGKGENPWSHKWQCHKAERLSVRWFTFENGLPRNCGAWKNRLRWRRRALDAARDWGRTLLGLKLRNSRDGFLVAMWFSCQTLQLFFSSLQLMGMLEAFLT